MKLIKCSNGFPHLNLSSPLVRLGQGSFGNVKLYQCKEKHQGENNYCNEVFVVKKVYKSADNYKNRIDLLHNEYNIGLFLQHPNIIKTLGYDIFRNLLILEHCPGLDLFESTNKEKYWSQVVVKKYLPLFGQLLSAVSYLHNLGISHNDIKLENIMYDKENQIIKLIDFEDSTFFLKNGERIPSDKMRGTIEYLPPWVYSHRPYFGDDVDVWSLGVVLFRLIYNDLPWKQAIMTDGLYRSCYYYFKDNELPFERFLNLEKHGYTQHEKQTLFKIFLEIFTEKKPSIETIHSIFKSLHS
jgi:serine/threonine protein kinase